MSLNLTSLSSSVEYSSLKMAFPFFCDLQQDWNKRQWLFRGGSMENGRWEGWNRIPATRGSDLSHPSVHFPSILLLFPKDFPNRSLVSTAAKKVKFFLHGPHGLWIGTTRGNSEAYRHNWNRGIEQLKTPIESGEIPRMEKIFLHWILNMFF